MHKRFSCIVVKNNQIKCLDGKQKYVHPKHLISQQIWLTIRHRCPGSVSLTLSTLLSVSANQRTLLSLYWPMRSEERPRTPAQVRHPSVQTTNTCPVWITKFLCRFIKYFGNSWRCLFGIPYLQFNVGSSFYSWSCSHLMWHLPDLTRQ